MTFERSTDFPLLTTFLRNPRLYPFLADDHSPAIEHVKMPRDRGLWCILARDAGVPFGFWLFVPRSVTLWEFHTVMPLDRRALCATRELLGPGGWLWSNTDCERAVTEVPEYNAIAARFGRRAGLTEYGRNPRSFKRRGQLQDLILMGISKE
jgi:hypothetical protein